VFATTTTYRNAGQCQRLRLCPWQQQQPPAVPHTWQRRLSNQRCQRVNGSQDHSHTTTPLNGRSRARDEQQEGQGLEMQTHLEPSGTVSSFFIFL
jgi:hypothetical protein